MAISILLVANTFEPDAPPALTTWSMFFGLAEANTSAGAPALICSARAELAPKLNVTFVPGLAASNCLPISVNDSVSEAAANTVMLPDSDAEPLSLADGLDRGARTAVLVGPAPGETDGDHGSRKKSDGESSHENSLVLARFQRGQRFLGISTETLVAFTAATANTPGSRPRSSTASRLSRETNRCGPA